jgi:peptide/nickel transport system substrate-binding protein
MSDYLTRRRLLRHSLVLLGASTLLQACGPSVPAAAPASGAATAVPTTASAAAAAQAKPTSAPAAGAGGAAGADKELIITIQSQIQTLDNQMHTVRDYLVINKPMSEELIGRDLETLKPKPRLATEWKYLDDLTMEVKLRPNVKWHDGTPFAANDVKFSLERVINPAQKSPRRPDFSWIDHVDVVDPLTVHIKTLAPSPTAVESLAGLSMVSEKYVRDKGDAAVADAPMGTGPYRFVSVDRAAGRVTMEINKDYWGEPKPSIGRVTFRTIPDQATQIAELLSGGVHAVRNVPADQISVVNSSGVADIRSKPILRLVLLTMDAIGRAGDTPLTKLEVRQAVMHAVDRKAILDRVLSGQGQLVEAPVNPFHFGYDPTVKNPYEYNPDKAKRLLAQAGYPSGFEADFYLSEDISVAEALIGYLAKVGIKANVRDFRGTGSALNDLVTAGKTKDLSYGSWGSNSIFDADAILYIYFHSSSLRSYANTPEMDAWLTEARSTLDEARRKVLYGQVQKFVMDQAYVLPVYARNTIEGISKNLVYTPSSDEFMYLNQSSWKA